ncbi:MAG TPA: DUF302 domain-containing protein [Anaerolineae bacterium]|nr:DUF302 domain-containing protein [Anaerolineae bacterium]
MNRRKCYDGRTWNPNQIECALSANLDVGLLLPCNVTVYEEGDGAVDSLKA